MAPVEIAEQIDKMTDAQFEHHALTVLKRELGAYGLARFLRVHHSGSGDYTRDRHQWLEGVSVEDIMSDAQELRASRG